MRRTAIVVLFLVAGWRGPQPAGAQDDISAALGPMLTAARLPGARWPDFARYRDVITRLYALEAQRSLWLDPAGISPQAQTAIGALLAAADHGLDPRDYDAGTLAGILARSGQIPWDPEARARFDLLLSLDLVRFLDDLQSGRLHRSPLTGQHSPGPSLGLADAMKQAIAGDSLARLIAALVPPLAQYQNLQKLLHRYRTLAADSSLDSVTRPVSLRSEDESEGVVALRRRLTAMGDLDSDSVTQETRDTGRDKAAVRRFQRRHGLNADGMLNDATLAAINTPLGQRVRQIELALERLRWLPPLRGQRFVVVNIPAFQLFAFDSAGGSGVPALSMKVIVGKALDTRTPLMLEDMRYVEFRPSWNVPRSILMTELVPELRRNSRFLAQNDMELVGPGDRVLGNRLSPEVIDQLSGGQLRVRQRPGSRNALGLVKFVFPNAAGVYLHGTPRTELFSHSRRDFSHGCIRVEDPTGLAVWVLRDQSGWGPEVIQSVQNGRSTTRAWLSRSIPVIVFYTTAVATPDGNGWFYADIYGHDRALDEALRAEPESP